MSRERQLIWPLRPETYKLTVTDAIHATIKRMRCHQPACEAAGQHGAARTICIPSRMAGKMDHKQLYILIRWMYDILRVVRSPCGQYPSCKAHGVHSSRAYLAQVREDRSRNTLGTSVTHRAAPSSIQASSILPFAQCATLACFSTQPQKKVTP